MKSTAPALLKLLFWMLCEGLLFAGSAAVLPVTTLAVVLSVNKANSVTSDCVRKLLYLLQLNFQPVSGFALAASLAVSDEETVIPLVLAAEVDVTS